MHTTATTTTTTITITRWQRLTNKGDGREKRRKRTHRCSGRSSKTIIMIHPRNRRSNFVDNHRDRSFTSRPRYHRSVGTYNSAPALLGSSYSRNDDGRQQQQQQQQQRRPMVMGEGRGIREAGFLGSSSSSSSSSRNDGKWRQPIMMEE